MDLLVLLITDPLRWTLGCFYRALWWRILDQRVEERQPKPTTPLKAWTPTVGMCAYAFGSGRLQVAQKTGWDLDAGYLRGGVIEHDDAWLWYVRFANDRTPILLTHGPAASEEEGMAAVEGYLSRLARHIKGVTEGPRSAPLTGELFATPSVEPKQPAVMR